MINLNKFSNIQKPIELFNLFLLSIFPLAIITGNLIINILIFLISITCIFNIKNLKLTFKDPGILLLVFFYISLIINLIFSMYFENTLYRVVKVFFVIFFIIGIKQVIHYFNKSYLKYVFLSWSIIFLIITFDILFEIIFGFNTFGNISAMPGRISSFFGDELVAGGFYHGFVLFFISYLVSRKFDNYTIIFAIISVLIISFLIGERSNFIKIFLSVTFFTFLVVNISYKFKLLISTFVLFAAIIVINLSDSYKTRYYYQVKLLFSDNGYSKYLKESQYGAHQDAAIQILGDHIYFGVGIKNFRHESSKKKYENKVYKKTKKRHSTHPHQIHHELLSETGIIGYVSIMIFIISSLFLAIKSYFKTKNLFQLSGIIFIVTSLIPILPSGSFWSTFPSSIFWLNYAIMMGYVKFKS